MRYRKIDSGIFCQEPTYRGFKTSLNFSLRHNCGNQNHYQCFIHTHRILLNCSVVMGIQRGFFVIKQYFLYGLKGGFCMKLRSDNRVTGTQGQVPSCAAQSPLPSYLDPLEKQREHFSRHIVCNKELIFQTCIQHLKVSFWLHPGKRLQTDTHCN